MKTMNHQDSVWTCFNLVLNEETFIIFCLRQYYSGIFMIDIVNSPSVFSCYTTLTATKVVYQTFDLKHKNHNTAVRFKN